MILNETVYGKPIIEEISREKLPDGVLCRVSYPICDIGKRNANGRVYEDAVWNRVHEDADIKDKVDNRALFGHAEHPEQTQSNLEKISHVIFEMWKDGDQEWQKIDIFDTPTGRIVDCLLKSCRVGMSTRAEGDLEEAEDDEGTYQRVVPESYNYVTTDFTADPSTPGAIPHDVKRNIVTEVKKMFETKDTSEGEQEFAEKVLESMQCKKEKDHECQNCGCCKVLDERKLSVKEDEKKTVANLLKEGILKEGTKVKYDDKDAKVKKIEEGTVSLTVGDGELTDVVVNGNANINITPEGLITIETAEAVAGMEALAKEPEPVPEELPEELPEEPIEDELIIDEPEVVEPELDDMDKDIVPESKDRLTKENLINCLGGVVKIEKGEHKDKQGKLTVISETGITIALDDGTTVSIEDPTAVNITVIPPAPKEEIEEVPAEEEFPGATEEEVADIEAEVGEEELPESKTDEARVGTKGGVSDKLADGNLLQDKDGKHWVVSEITDTNLLVTQPGQPGTEKSLGWDEVPNWGFTKLSERELEKSSKAVVVREKDAGWGVFITGDGKDRLLTRFDEKGDATKHAEKYAGDKGVDYKGVEESKVEESKLIEFSEQEKMVITKALKQIRRVLKQDNETEIHEEAIREILAEYGAGTVTEEMSAEVEKQLKTVGIEVIYSGVKESISTTVKEIKNLKIQAASTRVERDKAIELLEELTDEKQQLEVKVKKDKVFEIRMFVNRIEKTLEAKEREVDALRSKLEEKAKLASEQKKLVSETRANSLKGITDLTESVSKEAKIMKDDWAKSDKNHAKELDQLSEALKIEEKKHKETCKVLQEKIKETEKSVTEKVVGEVTEKFIKSFVEFRLSESNLKVDENSRALLEQSTSLEDVDDLLDEIVDASRRSALHSEAIRGIRVPKHTIPDPEGDRIKRNVSSVYEGMNG